MELEAIKHTIQRNYPQVMTYRKARRVRIGNGRKRLSLPRIQAVSEDRSLSVEFIGSKTNLHSVNFMIGMDDRDKAAASAYVTARCIHTAVPDWEDEEWFKQCIKHRKAEERGRVRLRWQLFPSKPLPIPVLFVRVRK